MFLSMFLLLVLRLEKMYIPYSLFSDEISTGWIHDVYAVWFHMDEWKSFCQHSVIGSPMLRDYHAVSKLTVLQTQIEKKGSAALSVWNGNILLI